MPEQDIVVLASRNRGKIRELARLLEPFGITLKGLDDFPDVGEIEETGTTFAENALLKACTVAKLTGHASIADDSGLEVDFLGGAPGVYSARYSDAPGRPATDARNNEKLLVALSEAPEDARGARFRCAMAACKPEGGHILASGAWEGRIGFLPKGENGFGYDPLFFDPFLGRSAAELPMEEKNACSHRAKAVAALMELWPGFWNTENADN